MLKPVFIHIVCFSMTLITNAQPPKNAVSFYNKGQKLKEQGMFYEAIQSFKKATVLYRSYDSAYLEWSGLYERMNKPDSAVWVLRNAIRQNPKLKSGFISLANLFKDKKMNFDSAALYYSAALQLDSTDKETLYNISWCYNSVKDYEKAIVYAVKLLDQDINHRKAYGEMAHAYHALKKYDEALVQFKKYAALSTCELPLVYSGFVYLELNQFDNVQQTMDELTKKGFKQASDGLKKRWDAKKRQHPGKGS